MKLLMLSSMLAVLCASASASPVMCGADLIANGTGVGAPITCPTIGDPGAFVTSITLMIESDYTGYESGNPVVNINYVTSGPVTFTPIPQQHVITIGGNNSFPAYTISVGGLLLAPISGITVTPTSMVVGGTVVGSSADVWLMDYTETKRLPQAPEPATLSLAGLALVGLGFLRRRV